jgi:predicted PolB exonuclease-like 3'-5' exonuclease
VARSPRAETLILDIETVPDLERWQRPEPPAPPPAPEVVDVPRDTSAVPADATPPTPAPPTAPTVRPFDPSRGDRGGRGDRDQFPPIWAHRIVCIGYLWLDHGYGLARFGAFTNPPNGTGSADDRERAMLEAFSALVGRERPLLVTYNGRSFDLPVMAMRSLCHAVPARWYYRDRDVRYRYSAEGHLDLCDWLADHGAIRAGKLDQITRLIGLPGKVGVDGSQVEGLYAQGDIAAIEKYCLADVAQTALLFLRFRLLQGILAPDVYRDRIDELVNELAAGGRVPEVLDGVDRARLFGITE